MCTDFATESATYLGGSALAASGVAFTSLVGGSLGLLAALWGGYKFMQWTQARQPVVFTPLTKRHKPLLAGIDGYKFDNFLANLNGKWTRFTEDIKKGWNEFWENDTITTWAQEKVADIVNR